VLSSGDPSPKPTPTTRAATATNCSSCLYRYRYCRQRHGGSCGCLVQHGNVIQLGLCGGSALTSGGHGAPQTEICRSQRQSLGRRGRYGFAAIVSLHDDRRCSSSRRGASIQREDSAISFLALAMKCLTDDILLLSTIHYPASSTVVGCPVPTAEEESEG